MIFAVLTVRNESEQLRSMLERLEKLVLPLYVIVVDDNSHDGSAEVVERHPGFRARLRLVQHVRRHGPGRALVAGLRQALTLRAGPDDLVVTLPGASADLAPLTRIARLLEEGMDLVVASRFVPEGGEPGLSGWQRLLSRGLAGLLRVLFPVAGVRDYTSGYRGLRLAVVERAFEVHGRNLVASSGEPGLAEFVIRLGRMGVRAAEVPLVVEGRPHRGRFGIMALLGYLRMILALLRPQKRPSRGLR